MTKVKICGIKTRAALDCAVKAGADYIGLVFAPSRRQVSIKEAKQLLTNLPKTVKAVGVFANSSLEELEAVLSQVPLDLLQIHGRLPDGLFETIDLPIIQALAIGDSDLPSYDPSASYLLFDAPQAGSGQPFDWQRLETSQLSKPFFIAGGLTPDNVAQAIQTFQPYGVDVSSGVETNGQKDLNKIRQFIESVTS